MNFILVDAARKSATVTVTSQIVFVFGRDIVKPEGRLVVGNSGGMKIVNSFRLAVQSN